MGKRDTDQLMNRISQMDANLDVQWGRVGLMERWLEDHSVRLESLSTRIDASLRRIDALLGKG
jgi:hypothetical protein